MRRGNSQNTYEECHSAISNSNQNDKSIFRAYLRRHFLEHSKRFVEARTARRYKKSQHTHTHTHIRMFSLTPISTFLCRQGGCYADSGFQEVLQVLRTEEGSVPKSSPQTNADSPPKCYHMQLSFDFCQQKCGSNHAVL